MPQSPFHFHNNRFLRKMELGWYRFWSYVYIHLHMWLNKQSNGSTRSILHLLEKHKRAM